MMGLLWWGGFTLGITLLVRVVMWFVNGTNIDLGKLGKWAVITGATDGIGLAFAHELAKKGLSVVLISGNPEKLRDVAQLVEERYGVATKVIMADFSVYDETTYEIVRDELRYMEIGVLINNFGSDSVHPEYFVDLEKHHQSVYAEMICSNIWTTVNLTRYVLPGMLKRGKGLIINVSSLLVDFPAPLNSMYAASKAFVTKFSTDLDLECRENDVHVHVLHAGPVSKKSFLSEGRWTPAVSPEIYAESALTDASKKRVCTGHISHTVMKIIGKLSSALNPWLFDTIVLSIVKRTRKARIELCIPCQTKRKLL